ncbi:MAG: hypothetical protein LBT95_02365 [Treponema sp.]|jgi:hypothetical protein|nr:hypothetical protein [Treponema sp.]
MKEKFKFLAVLLAAALVLMACPLEDDGDGNGGSNGINWDDESGGTLTVINNTSKDIVLFEGQTPSNSTILGGVKALDTRELNISDDVDNFEIGGYMILRGITKDEYEANKTNLSQAKIEYSAMATYGQGKKFRTEISPNWTGDFGYRVNNTGRIGMELRKDSPDGEKIGYLPRLAANYLLYANSQSQMVVFPLFVYYDRRNGQVTTLQAASVFEGVAIDPRSIVNSSAIQTYYFPSQDQWDRIKDSLTSPVAYITVTNNVANQGARFTIAASRNLVAQNGYGDADGVASGETLTFELKSTASGTPQNLVCTLYQGAIQVPVRVDGESTEPVIKNGYDYTVTLRGSGQEASGYTAVITESATVRDLSNEIDSL